MLYGFATMAHETDHVESCFALLTGGGGGGGDEYVARQ